jgi:hypothetical protein
MLASPICHGSTRGKQNSIVVRFELIILITCGMVSRVACELPELHVGCCITQESCGLKLVLEKNAVQLLLQVSLELP